MSAVTLWAAKVWRALVAAAKWLWSQPVVLAGLVGAFIGAILMVRSKRNQVSRLSAALEVQRIKAEVARDEAKAEALTERADEHAGERVALHAQIVASKRRAVELAHATSLEDKSDEEIAKLFSDAGL